MKTIDLQPVRSCQAAEQVFNALGIKTEPYMNFVFDGRYIVTFIWDNRKVIHAIDLLELQKTNVNAFTESLKFDKVPTCPDSKTPLVDYDNLLPRNCQGLKMISTDTRFSFVDDEIRIDGKKVGYVRDNYAFFTIVVDNEVKEIRFTDVDNKPFESIDALQIRLMLNQDMILTNYAVTYAQ